MPTDLELARDEIVALIESEAQRRYGLSAEELIGQYRAGSIDECGGAADIVSLARLLPEGDPLHLAS